ncbi:MAG: hypothetical protein K6F01_09070 [Selenomonas sp.]|uniref:hypothetical protein n=1 Tax=Selenomonas sp. TaxID=2053611 RepID=UPI0025DB47C2|nr:hypothetical protein [Selenomonas sp.]MCR5439565.1 hypothetical protein [Selenomonas sp.]
MGKEKKLSIYDSYVMLHDRKTVFERKKLLDEKVSLVVPEDFAMMDEETRRKIYAVSDVPGELYSNEQGCFVVGLKQAETAMEENRLENAMKIMKKVFPYSAHNAKLLSSKFLSTQNARLGVLEYVHETLLEQVYQIMFLGALEKRLLVGSLHFSFADSEWMLPLAEEILASYCDLTKKVSDEV